MAVDLPSTEDVRKARHNAAKTAAERAEVARTPLLAFLGAGDLAVTAVSKAVTEARTQAEGVQHRISGLSGEELRRAVTELRTQVGQAYEGFAEQGERTWGRIRTQPQVKGALARIETYTEKLDARVDDIVDDTHDAAEKARATQRFSRRTAQTVSDVSKDASRNVAQVGTDAAGSISEAGAEAAHETRSTTRKAANRTAPKTAASKPAERRTSTNGDKSSS